MEVSFQEDDSFVIYFLGNSDTNYDSLLKNITYTGPPRLRWVFFRLFRHKPGQVIVEYYLHWITTFEISFSGSSDTNRGSLCYMSTTSLSVSSGDPNTRKRYETRARSASVLLFSSVWSPDETRETSCLHNISNENISLAVQFIKRN